jgi:flagellar biogenesis protein FliO
MKFIRNAKIRDRVVDLVSKAVLIAISALFCLWMVSGAHAVPTSIDNISVSPEGDGYSIEFALSQKVDPKSVAVEFERNFIQLSLRGVSAYPARTETINQGGLEKVFTYQYQPDLARARVLLKTSAAAIKDKSSWELTAKGVRILVKAQGSNAQASASDTVKSKAASVADTEEDRLVREILSENKPQETKKAPPAAKSNAEEQPLFATKTNTEEKPKEEGAATRVFASLLLVVGLIGATAVAYRRFALGKGITFQRQTKVIDVVSTQAIGPKRSVALIKVLDQYMVVGMAGDGMSLLANLGSDVKIEKFIDQAGPGSSFSDAFDNAMTGEINPSTATGTGAVAQKAPVGLGIRSAIKKRIEGYKQL